MLETLAQAVVNGLLIGGIYALVSIGVTLIFGVVKIVNFAQGEFVMIGMYISFFLATRYGIDPLLSLAVSMPAPVPHRRAVAAFPDPPRSGAWRHAADLPHLRAVAAADERRLAACSRPITGPCKHHIRTRRSISVRSTSRWQNSSPSSLAMVLSGMLWVFLHTTDHWQGDARGGAEPDVAMLMGINPDRVFCVAVGVSLALAGAAGSLLMPFYPASTDGWPGVRADGVRRRRPGHARQHHRRADREPDDGRRGVARAFNSSAPIPG